VNRFVGHHLEWGIRLEGQSSCFPFRIAEMVYALIRCLAYTDEIDFDFVLLDVFLGYG
jgi:hypothetical protein